GRARLSVLIAGHVGSGDGASIGIGPHATQTLDRAAVFLAFEPLPLRGLGRAGLAPRDRALGGAADQFDQTLERIGAIAFLRTVLLGDNDDYAFLGETAAGKPLEACANVFRQRRRMGDVEAKAHGGRKLIDVLPA